MRVSVLIPAQNEADAIGATVAAIATALVNAGRDHEVIVVDDASTDGTAAVVESCRAAHPSVRCVRSHYPRGFGYAVRAGLDVFDGDAVAIVMGDGSDSPSDLLRYFEVIDDGYDCAFGSRFHAGSRVTDYPYLKLAINRIVNVGIRALFAHGYNDTTNAFKAYRRSVIENVGPLVSNHFNLTVELPLKAIVRGHSYAVDADLLDEPRCGAVKARSEGNGLAVPVHRAHGVSRAPPFARRLPAGELPTTGARAGAARSAVASTAATVIEREVSRR